MTGLESIIRQILADAQAKADEQIKEAEASAEEILAQARAQAEKTAADIQRKSERDVENYKKSAASTRDLYRRTEVLKSKQEVISQVVRRAYDTVCNMDADNYFAMMENIIAKNIMPEDGVVYFSKTDIDRMPAGFPERVEQLAKNAGGTLTISQTGKQIENGFVFVYGGVENNCTVKALFDANYDRIQDIVHALLYGKEA